MRTDHFAELLLRILAITIALFAWSAVVFAKIPVAWKGGNWAPLSMRSRIVAAVAMTAWCFAAFRIYPRAGAAVFALCIGYGLLQSRRDRVDYDRARGVTAARPVPIARRQGWIVLCCVDAAVLLIASLAIAWDWRFPPITEEQHIVHVMGLGFLWVALVGALVLFVKRPQKGS